jgi:hypothetical protein
MPDEAGAKGGRGKKALSNRQSFSGTTAAYLLGRLKRDYPSRTSIFKLPF